MVMRTRKIDFHFTDGTKLRVYAADEIVSDKWYSYKLENGDIININPDTVKYAVIRASTEEDT